VLKLISEKEVVVWTGKDGREALNIEKAEQLFMYWYQKAGRNHNSNVPYKSFKDMAKFIANDSTDQSGVHRGIKNSLKLINACCHVVWNILSTCVLSKNVRINIPC
jgi:hypothetical protein